MKTISVSVTVTALCLPLLVVLPATGQDAPSPAGQENSAADGWVQLFNGRDLDGWTPKFAGHPLGANFRDTFRVENGLLRVVYDNYQDFDRQFGHLFYKTPFSHYRLRLEYRFVGQQVPGGPGWALRNSGAMLHCQPPETMEQDQDFPVSIEMQLLGGNGTDPRTTANLCTPSTHVVMDDKLIKRHCISSSSKTYHGDQWVTVDIVVRGSKSIEHQIDGVTVLAYADPQLDDTDQYGAQRLTEVGSKSLTSGYISLQAESHPLEFRKVALLPLKD